MAGGATTTLLDALTKDVYLPGLHDYINRDRPLWGMIERLPQKQFKGRQFTWAAKISDNQSFAPVPEGATLPDPGNVDPINLSMALKYHYDTARLTAQAAELVDGEGAFEDSVTTELDSARDGLVERIYVHSLYGDGSGELGQVSAYSGTTLTMINQPVNGGIGNRLLRRNMRLSSYAAKTGGSLNADYKTLGAISPAGATAVAPASAGFVANDYVFQSRAAGTDPRNAVTMGLGGIVDDGTRVATIFGKSRSTYPELQALVLANGGTLRAVTPDLLNDLTSYANQNGGGKYGDVLISQKPIVDRMAAYLALDRRGTMDTMELKGGYKTVGWMVPNKGLVPWLADKFCRPNEIMNPYMKDLFWAIHGEPFNTVRGDGHMWRYTDRSDALECWFRDWRNLGSYGFNNHAVARDVSHTA